MNIGLQIPEQFLQEEERIGYTVTKQMKKTWAVQLDLLNEIKRVCEKYQLSYYADSGTLIGAVRHKGYIPWDDDIDLVMKRSDYDKLIELGAIEFKQPYFLQSAHSEIFPRGYARLRNSDSTAMTAFDLGKNINHGIFIDVFPLDNIPDKLSERKRWFKRINQFYKVIKWGASEKNTEYSGIIRSIKYYMCRSVFKLVGYKNLIRLYEELCTRYNKIPTKSISYVAYSRGKEKHIWESSCFDASHEVPFEFTKINIPNGYDSRLKVEYNDYMTIAHTGTAHGTVVFDPDTPYTVYLQKHTEEEIFEQIHSEKEKH